MAPVAPERFVLHLTIGQRTHDKLRYAQDLLRHAITSGDLGEVLDRVLDLAVGQLEKRKFAATRQPRSNRRPTASRRHVPAQVKWAVWARDGGRCAFVSADGRRCPARSFLEYDHVEPVARGGRATVAGLRLRCRGHNQYEAERAFGADYMKAKREAARRERAAAATARARAVAERARAKAAVAVRAPAAAEQERARVAAAEARALADEHSKDVIACLRTLGFRAEQARRAAGHCTTLPDGSLEERVRAALRLLCPSRAVRPSTCPGACSPAETGLAARAASL